MKISIENLKWLIQEAMISTVPEGGSVQIEHDGRNLSVTIKQKGVPKAHSPGWIKLNRVQVEDGAIWEVNNSAANKGFGPFLYDVAMEYVVSELGDLGIMCDRTSVSQEASRVWQYYFENRDDVEKEELPKIWLTSGQLGSRPEWLKNYYYKLDSPKLTELSNQGLLELIP